MSCRGASCSAPGAPPSSKTLAESVDADRDPRRSVQVRSDDIREGPLHPPEVEHPGDEEQSGDDGARRDETERAGRARRAAPSGSPRRRRPSGSGRRPSPAAPCLASLATTRLARIDHGRDEQPDLHEERNDVAHVAVLRRSAPTARCPTPSVVADGEDQQERQAAGSPAERPDPVVGHHAEEDDERERRSRPGRENGRRRDDEPREIDLLDEVRRAHEALRRLAEPEREEGPRQESGEREERIRQARPSRRWRAGRRRS